MSKVRFVRNSIYGEGLKKNVAKPCEGETHARFDEGRMKISSAYSTAQYGHNLIGESP